MAGETSSSDVVARTFRALVESAEKKFARVRDAPSYGGKGPYSHYFHSVFKAYMRLWKYQQENRAKLMESGLQRWEIGEIASRIGQLYFSQYMRTSEARYLIEAYVFYEAILNRRYFEEGSKKDKGVRFKELRFYARFLMVSLILNKSEMVKVLVDKFGALVDDSKSTFPVRFPFIFLAISVVSPDIYDKDMIFIFLLLLSTLKTFHCISFPQFLFNMNMVARYTLS